MAVTIAEAYERFAQGPDALDQIPDFDAAVKLHRLLDTIEPAPEWAMSSCSEDKVKFLLLLCRTMSGSAETEEFHAATPEHPLRPKADEAANAEDTAMRALLLSC